MAGLKDIRLEGRVALVTGAGSGLGRAMAQALARHGADVVFLDIDLARAEMAARAVRGAASAGRVLALGADITRAGDCETAVRETVETLGGLHILVNCAARGNIHVLQSPKTRSLRFWEADPEQWTKVIDTNVNGHFLMAHHAAPVMIAARWGRIVNITTSLPTLQRASNSPYSVSKVAMEGATIVWAKDLEGTGVTCNSLLPGGAVDTPFLEPGSRKELGGRLLQPDVIVPPLLWLASNLSDGVTGARFNGRLWDASLAVNAAAARAWEAPVIMPVPAGTR
jgi:3-oxoacyl-[acyl-carrier protein] reductase